MIPIVLYAAAFAAANIITANTDPLEVSAGGELFLITWGTWLIGFTFILRDVIQLAHGRAAAYAAIGLGAAVAAITSAVLGDTLAVVTGSVLAIAVGETLDTEVFTRVGGRIPLRIMLSGIVGSIVDTSVFVVVALSPLWSKIIPWDVVPNAIIGVAVVKCALQILAGALWRLARGPEPLPEAAR